MKELLTLSEAKAFLRENISKGVACPCCNGMVKMYHRPITSSMAYGLILMYNTKREWVHIESVFKGMDIPASIRGDIPKLRFWNLIEPNGKGKEDKNPNSGEYRVTDLGRRFVLNAVDVPSHVMIYNNKFYGYPRESTMVNIVGCLKNKFNYSKIINNEI